MDTTQKFSCATALKEIGRGKEGAASLSQPAARELMAAILNGQVSDLELGAVLMALRFKGEGADEVIGFLRAVQDFSLYVPGFDRPAVVIPTYNGARTGANLTPLLACLLAREGIPTIVHGSVSDIPAFARTRVTTADIFQAMGLQPALSVADIQQRVAQREPAFVPITVLAPRLAWLLSLRRTMGVRNCAHTLAKLLNPVHGPALMLACYTHPEYASLLAQVLQLSKTPALLMRATEGEPVANAKRPAAIDAFANGIGQRVYEGVMGSVTEMPILPPDRSAASTAVFVQNVMSGQTSVPPAIAAQIQCVRESLKALVLPNTAPEPQAA